MRHIIFFIIISLFYTSCKKEKESIKPEIRDLTISVYASATVQPKDLYTVYTSTSGILERIFVEDGDSVKKHQIIAQITTDNPKINLDNAMLNVDLARENYIGKSNALSNIKDEINATEKQVKLDSINYVRLKSLWEQGVGKKSELDAQQLKYELGLNQLSLLKTQYKQTSIDLENSYKKAQNALKQAETNLSDYFIKSRLDGKIYSVLKEEGEILNMQEPFAIVGDADKFVIELLIDEVDISRIKIGQSVIIALDAYENQVFEAAITRIYPLKDSKTQTFKIEAEFNDIPESLYAGLSGEANIVINKIPNVLTIPSEFLTGQNKVKTSDKTIAVVTGEQNLEFVQIISGIDSSTVIYKP